MKSKLVSLLFSIVLISLVTVAGIAMFITDENLKNENSDELEESGQSAKSQLDNELLQFDNEKCKEQEVLEAERQAYLDAIYESEIETHKGEYKGCYDSSEVNADFITDEYHFRQIVTYNELEFVGYEELDDLSAYVNSAEWAFTDEWRYYINLGAVNEDGSFNKVTQKIRVRYGNLDYGEENVLENQELVAVKLKIKYSNLSKKRIELEYSAAHRVEDFVFMDDGKLYRKTSVYNSDFLVATLGPVCTNMSEKYGEYENIIALYPQEEYMGEVIYLFLKEELEDIYFIIDSGQHGENGENSIENFNAIGIRLLPLTELKKLEVK